MNSAPAAKFEALDIDNFGCMCYVTTRQGRHCVAAEYLKDTDWMLVLDADTAVINPNHCIEEWIDDRVDVILYERFFNYEISAATYMILFLPGAIQARQNCYDVWYNATNYESYMASVSCVKQALGATRLWPGKLRIYRKAHGWARDGFLTSGKWHDGDFMFHGWKGNHVKDDQWGAPFTEMPNLSLCGHGKDGWHWDEKMHVNVSVIKSELASFEKHAGNTFTPLGQKVIWFAMPDIGQCYPDCERYT
ncbi:hypothetical protein OSTOST_21528 [Ostertagia ostertagi]